MNSTVRLGSIKISFVPGPVQALTTSRTSAFVSTGYHLLHDTAQTLSGITYGKTIEFLQILAKNLAPLS
jgi:hypothetical protein